MNKKQYLKKGFKLKKEIEHDKEVLKELRLNLDGLQALHNSEKLQGGPVKDDSGIVNKMNRIIELENKIEAEICELNDFKVELLKSLGKIKNKEERILMESRYFLNLTWEQIAEKLCYSLSHTFKLHGRALENFKISEK